MNILAVDDSWQNMAYPTPTFLSGLSRHFIASWNEYQGHLKLSNPRPLGTLIFPEKYGQQFGAFYCTVEYRYHLAAAYHMRG